MENFSKRLQAVRRELTRKTVLFIACIFLLGAFSAFWARFVLVQKDDVHYHANFAVYIDGEREEFENFTFYEEVSACTGDYINNPPTRVHMHDQINHVVHVHDRAVTWGHFFANLGFTLGNKILATPSGVYVSGENKAQLRFMLNGESVATVANRVIESEDTLLVVYGQDAEDTLSERYSTIARDAADYNKRQDPSSCSGGKPESFSERLKRTLGLGIND